MVIKKNQYLVKLKIRNIIILFILVLLISIVMVIYNNPGPLTLLENMNPKEWKSGAAALLDVSWTRKSWKSSKKEKMWTIEIPKISGLNKVKETLGDDVKGECSYTVNFDFDSKLKKDLLYTLEKTVKQQYQDWKWEISYDGEQYYKDLSGKFYRLEFKRNNQGDEEKIYVSAGKFNNRDYFFFGYYWSPCSTMEIL